jgi:predicted XRE-type DNA-binding protein
MPQKAYNSVVHPSRLLIKKMTETVQPGSDNVYADLGYMDAAEMQRKSMLAHAIAMSIKARKLTQEAAAQLLGIDQAKISRITRGQFRGVSEAKMLELMAKLGHNVKISVSKSKRNGQGTIDLQIA